jgi:hypothetical protein
MLAGAAMILLACGSGGTSTSVTPSISGSPTGLAVGTTTPSADDPATTSSFPIPNGTYEATATRREALEKGFSNKEIDEWYGPDGKLPISFELDDGSFLNFVVGDDGVKELGAKGTYTATKKLWIPTSEGEGCPGCTYTYRWSFDGKVLSLELVSGSEGPADFREVRLVTEHDYVKVG